MTTVYIYGLINPNEPDIIRYIGATINPTKRMIGHKSENHTSKKGKWIESLITQGIEPKMIILAETDQELAASVEDKFLIRHGDTLVNESKHSTYFSPSKMKKRESTYVGIRIQNEVLRVFKEHAKSQELNYQTLIKEYLEKAAMELATPKSVMSD